MSSLKNKLDALALENTITVKLYQNPLKMGSTDLAKLVASNKTIELTGKVLRITSDSLMMTNLHLKPEYENVDNDTGRAKVPYSCIRSLINYSQ